MITINPLGQTIEPGVWVFRGGGSSGGGTNTRVGKAHKWSDKSKTWHVKWYFNIYDNEISYQGDEPSGSNVPISQLTTLDRQTVDRLDCIQKLQREWDAMHRRPEWNDFMGQFEKSGVRNYYKTPEYRQAREDYENANRAWSLAKKNFINDELNSRGFVLMP